MILKNKNFGKTKRVTIAEFGKGTLSIVNAENEGYQSLLIKSQDKNNVGSLSDVGSIDSDDFKPELVLAFHNKESFNIFYEYVLNIKNKFENN